MRRSLLACAWALLGPLPCWAAEPVVVVLQNHQFVPSVLSIPAGARVELEVRNLDDTADEFESSDIGREKLVPAGGSVRVRLGPLEPGQYRFFGDFHQDTAKGLILVK